MKYYNICHAMWLAIIVDESLIVNLKGLNRNSGVKSVPVQFFGTHDFARINMKQVISFLRGLLSSFHLKCKKSHFVQSLEEAKMYLSEQKLPKRMLKMQNAVEADDCESGSREDEKGADSGEDCRGDERIHSKLEGTKTCPFEIGDLQMISLVMRAQRLGLYLELRWIMESRGKMASCCVICSK
ncbi:histone-lysine N-methyltransferase ATX2-like isoform X5 [Camellia sinensis]|uniref:histone-lysine N-methyltransferase ATX2-like isoform X5 n=1 Tax=Camellia sinensis TaxID=4442 RepID=UPI001036B13E|nr:histone-lysine N-methyltransferase ATX2-like isoform X5 [Camellia sinensis]